MHIIKSRRDVTITFSFRKISFYKLVCKTLSAPRIFPQRKQKEVNFYAIYNKIGMWFV